MNTYGCVGIGLLTLALSSPVFATDIRDYLPHGRIFEVSALGFDVTWSTSLQRLSMTFEEPGASTITLNVSTWVDSNDRLQFRGRPALGQSDDLYQITGFVDILANGEYLLEYNVDWLNQDVSAGRVWSDVNLVTYEGQVCDCEDGITLSCNTEMCTSETKCTHVINDKCKWKPAFAIP